MAGRVGVVMRRRAYFDAHVYICMCCLPEMRDAQNHIRNVLVERDAPGVTMTYD